jgi:hypothetical protein
MCRYIAESLPILNAHFKAKNGTCSHLQRSDTRGETHTNPKQMSNVITQFGDSVWYILDCVEIVKEAAGGFVKALRRVR